MKNGLAEDILGGRGAQSETAHTSKKEWETILVFLFLCLKYDKAGGSFFK